jgi:hypothetical protein
MMLDFVTELVEARLFRYQRNVRGMTNTELAELIYTVLLVLLAHRHLPWAQGYADSSTDFRDYQYMRSGATDLANLLTALNHFDQHDIAINNQQISLPQLQFKQLLLEIARSTSSPSQLQRLTLIAENSLKTQSSVFRELRRTALGWSRAAATDRRKFVRITRQFLIDRAYTADFTVWYRRQYPGDLQQA